MYSAFIFKLLVSYSNTTAGNSRFNLDQVEIWKSNVSTSVSRYICITAIHFL